MAGMDFSELDRLAADLGEVPKRAAPLIRKAIEVTSFKVKTAAGKTAGTGDPRWRPLPSAIDYEIKTFQGFGASVIQSEIGYDKDSDVGKLGNIREFGTPRVAPHNDLKIALEANQDDFEKGLMIALEQAEKAAGL